MYPGKKVKYVRVSVTQMPADPVFQPEDGVMSLDFYAFPFPFPAFTAFAGAAAHASRPEVAKPEAQGVHDAAPPGPGAYDPSGQSVHRPPKREVCPVGQGKQSNSRL